MNGLARDDAGRGGAHVHRVGIHHPRHDLRVGVHVGCWNILHRSDDDADLAGVAAGETLKLLLRQLLGIDANAALGAAVGQIDRGRLHSHPGRKRHHFFEGHLRMVTDTALAGASCEVVLDAKALEMAHGAVVHLDWDVDDEAALGVPQRIGQRGKVAEVRNDAIHLREVGGPRAVGMGTDVGKERARTIVHPGLRRCRAVRRGRRRVRILIGNVGTPGSRVQPYSKLAAPPALAETGPKAPRDLIKLSAKAEA